MIKKLFDRLFKPKPFISIRDYYRVDLNGERMLIGRVVIVNDKKSDLIKREINNGN